MTTFKDARRPTPTRTLPVDGVLMQLGRAALVAGKKDDATRAFTRVVDEFPQSLYATEAKEKLAEHQEGVGRGSERHAGFVSVARPRPRPRPTPT